MSRLLMFVGATAGSAIGWWIGAWVGFMTACVLSMIGTAAGIYLGRRLAHLYFL